MTLTGVGGVGKTRLALQIAAEVIGEFPDGAWLCDFAPVTDPAAVWETVATSLRVQPLPGRALDESVLDYLATKRLLLCSTTASTSSMRSRAPGGRDRAPLPTSIGAGDEPEGLAWRASRSSRCHRWAPGR